MDFKLTTPNNDTFILKFSNIAYYSTNIPIFGPVYYYNIDADNVFQYNIIAYDGGYRMGRLGSSLRGNQITTSSSTTISLSAEVMYIQN